MDQIARADRLSYCTKVVMTTREGSTLTTLWAVAIADRTSRTIISGAALTMFQPRTCVEDGRGPSRKRITNLHPNRMNHRMVAGAPSKVARAQCSGERNSRSVIVTSKALA